MGNYLFAALEFSDKNENKVIKDISGTIESLGNPASITGVIFLLPISSLVSGIVTIVGGAAAGISLYQSKHFESLCNALTNGEYNICIYSKYTTNDLILAKNAYEGWKNTNYINKYYEYMPYTQQHIPAFDIIKRSRCEINAFDNTKRVVRQNIDHSWELID